MLDADELEARYSGMPMLLAEFGALDVDGNGFLDKDELAHQEERHIDPHKDKAAQHAAPADAHAAPADAHDAASRTADHSRHSKDAAAAGHGIPTGTLSRWTHILIVLGYIVTGYIFYSLLVPDR